MKILCIGNSAYDIILKLKKFPIINTKQQIEKKIECPGGRAQTVSLLLGKYNLDVTLITEIGNDYYGNKILSNLKELNIDTKYINKTDKTNINTILINGINRTVLKEVSDTNPNIEVNINNYDIIYTDGKYYDLSKKIMEQAKDKITILDLEEINNKSLQLANLAKYVICSKTTINSLTKEKNYIRMYQQIKKKFKNNLIITLGEDGAIFNDEITPALKMNSVDTTSAGDIFVGAFIYAKSKNLKDEDAIKLSVITSSLSTEKYGSSISIPELKEIKKL